VTACLCTQHACVALVFPGSSCSVEHRLSQQQWWFQQAQVVV
jgi:hypothetical protein